MADSDNSTLEDARKRARRRLMGAVVLALTAAVVLPMFLESDPRPLGPDVQIQIPAIDDTKFQNRLTPPGTSKAPAADKATQAVPPDLVKAPRETAETGAVATPATAPTIADPAASKADPPASTPAPVVASGPGETKRTIQPAAAKAKKSATPAPAVAPMSATASEPAASLPAFSLTATVPPLGATAAPELKTAPPAPLPVIQGEYVVQLGAFLDSSVARDLAAKAGEQGYSAFLEAVTTKSGQVQRVRVGPFASRGEADAATAKLKAAGFTAVARPR